MSARPRRLGTAVGAVITKLIPFRLLSVLGAIFIRVLNGSLRARHVHPEHVEQTPQYILAFWHAHLLLMLHSRFRKPIAVMSSLSKDGEIIARVYRWYGVETARGSSSRGGTAAIRELIRFARNGRNIVFTPDGPKGPARLAKSGVVYAARATGLPIVPMAFTAKRQKLLSSWDRMVVPYPFSRAIYLYGEPIHVPRDGNEEEWRAKIEQALNDLANEAERDLDQLWLRGAKGRGTARTMPDSRREQ